MKQNLRGKAFVAFVCLVGKRLLPKIVVGNHLQKKSSQSAMNLAYNVTDNTDGAKRFGLRRCCARFKRENHGLIFGLWHSFVIPHSDFVISEHPCHPCDPWLSPLLPLRVYSSGSCRIRG